MQVSTLSDTRIAKIQRAKDIAKLENLAEALVAAEARLEALTQQIAATEAAASHRLRELNAAINEHERLAAAGEQLRLDAMAAARR